MRQQRAPRHREPSNFDAFKFCMRAGFCLLLLIILVGAVYIGGLAQYNHMLVDPT